MNQTVTTTRTITVGYDDEGRVARETTVTVEQVRDDSADEVSYHAACGRVLDESEEEHIRSVVIGAMSEPTKGDRAKGEHLLHGHIYLNHEAGPPAVDAIAAALAIARAPYDRLTADLRKLANELTNDEAAGIPPHVPLLIEALNSFITAAEEAKA